MLATGCADRKLRLWDAAALAGSGASAAAAAVFEHPAGAGVRRVVWAPSGGAPLVTGAEDGVVRAWDPRAPAAGGPARAIACGAGAAAAPVMDIELCAGGAGGAGAPALLVSAGRSVLLLDARSLELRARFDFRHEVESATLLPGGRHFVCGGADCHLHTHALDGGAEVGTDRGHHGTVHAVRAAADGASYASGADDATIRLWPVVAARFE